MEKGLYVNPTTFVPLNQIQENLTSEMATRQFALGGFVGFFNYLPDPDPILRKLNMDQTAYEDLLSDSRVGAMVTRRKNLTKSLDWDIDAGEGATDKEINLCKLALKTLEANDCKTKDIISQALNPIFYGYSVFEITWGFINGYLLPVKLQEKPREWFIFGSENELRFRNAFSYDGIVIRGKDAKPEYSAKFILLQNDPTYKNPYGDKAISRCFWPVTFKRGGMKLFSEFIERFGMPFIYGKLPRGAKQQEHDALFSQLTNFISGAVGTGPDDSSVQLLETKGTTSGDLHGKFLDRCDNAISEALLTNSLSTSIQKVGARASSETGADTIETNLSEEDRDLPTSLFGQLFKFVVDINLGTGQYPVMKVFELEDVNKDKSERDKNLKEVGVTFTKKYFVENYNLEEDDFELSQPQQPVIPYASGALIRNPKIPVPGDPASNIQNPEQPQQSFAKRFSNWLTNKLEFANSLSLQKDGKGLPADLNGGVRAASGFAIADEITNAIPDKLMQFAMEETLRPVIELAKNSNSFDEFKINLAKQYPNMDDAHVIDLATKAFFIADLEGKRRVQLENKN